MATLVTVNGSATDQNGIAYPNAIITYSLTLTDIDPSDGYIFPEQRTVRSDAAGDFSLVLWPNARGSKGSQYRVIASSVDGRLLFDLLATVPYDPTPGFPNIYTLSTISVPAQCDECGVDGAASADVTQAIADAIAVLKAESDPFPQYTDLNDLAVVAKTGRFADLVDEPQSSDDITQGTTNLYMTSAEKTKLGSVSSGAEANVQADWNQTNTSFDDFIKNKPSIPASSDDLSQGSTNLFMTAAERSKLAIVEQNIQSDWSQTDNTKDDFIQNKPSIPTSSDDLTEGSTNLFMTTAERSKLATVEQNVQSDWSQTDDTLDSYIQNKPSIPSSADDLIQGSTNLFLTTSERTKLSGIAAGAEVNVQPDWSQSDNTKDDYIKNKPNLNLDPSFMKWAPLTGNITLSDADKGKSYWVTSSAIVTLPSYASLSAGWQVEFLMSDNAATSAYTLTFLPQGSDTLRANVATLTGDGAVGASYSSGEFLVMGIDPPDSGIASESDPVFVASAAHSITSADITNLGNLSGINTGDQDLSGYALISSIGIAGGIAPLDTNGIVPAANLPAPAAETDPIYAASPAAGITTADVSNLRNQSGINTGDQDLSGYALTSSIGVASGIAPLDASGIVPTANLPTPAAETDPVFLASEAYKLTASDLTNLRNQSGTNTGDQDLSGYALISSIGIASGIAPLDVNGIVPTANLPTLPTMPATSLDSTLAAFSGTTGSVLKDTGISVDSSDNLSGYGSKVRLVPSGNVILANSDKGSAIVFTATSGSSIVYLPDSSTAGLSPGYKVSVINQGGSSITIQAFGTDTVSPAFTSINLVGISCDILLTDTGSWSVSSPIPISLSQREQILARDTIFASSAITLSSSNGYQDVSVSADTTITLPDYTTLPYGWWVRITPSDSKYNSDFAIALATTGTDTVSEAVIRGDSIVLASVNTPGMYEVVDIGHHQETIWQSVSANLTLTDADHGKTLYVTADVDITLPSFASCRPGWRVIVMPDDAATSTAHSISLTLQGSDTVRGSVSSVTGDCSIMKTPTSFAVGDI